MKIKELAKARVAMSLI